MLRLQELIINIGNLYAYDTENLMRDSFKMDFAPEDRFGKEYNEESMNKAFDDCAGASADQLGKCKTVATKFMRFGMFSDLEIQQMDTLFEVQSRILKNYVTSEMYLQRNIENRKKLELIGSSFKMDFIALNFLEQSSDNNPFVDLDLENVQDSAKDSGLNSKDIDLVQKYASPQTWLSESECPMASHFGSQGETSIM